MPNSGAVLRQQVFVPDLLFVSKLLAILYLHRALCLFALYMRPVCFAFYSVILGLSWVLELEDGLDGYFRGA